MCIEIFKKHVSFLALFTSVYSFINKEGINSGISGRYRFCIFKRNLYV